MLEVVGFRKLGLQYQMLQWGVYACTLSYKQHRIFFGARMTEGVFPEEVDALELFKSEMLCPDVSVRLECVRNIDIIAFALGKAKTETSLVPLISDCIKGIFGSDDDEILLAFAKNIPNLIPYLSSDTGPGVIVGMLELLAAQDETVIREAAVASLTKMARLGGDSSQAILMRLFKADWFSQKLSACGLAASVYPNVSVDNKGQIRALYLACANDETPMVKRAAATHLCEMIEVVEKPFVISELVPLYITLSHDDTQDAVRLSCVSSSLALCKIFSEVEIQTHVRDTVAALAMDKSWRVRLAVVKVYGALCSYMGKEATISHLMEPLICLMNDQEPDVRKAAVVALQSTVKLLTPSLVISHFVPLFPLISKDPVQQVRSALSECIAPLSRTLGREFTISHILPLLMDSVKDDHPTIRYNATSSIAVICEVVRENDSVISQLTGLLQTLSHDGNWRTRLAVLEQIAPLCRLFGREMYETKLESLFLSFFSDSVSAVREALSVEIEKLVGVLGEDWTVDHFTSKVLTLYSETNSYSSRVAILQTLPRLASVVSKNADKLFLPTVQQACKDPVPNVRFVACNVAERLSRCKSTEIKQSLKDSLEPLLADQDIDVRYFASRAIQ